MIAVLIINYLDFLVVFFAGAFLATGFFTTALGAATFLVTFLTACFFATGFLAAGFVTFLAAGLTTFLVATFFVVFFATGLTVFLAGDFLATGLVTFLETVFVVAFLATGFLAVAFFVALLILCFKIIVIVIRIIISGTISISFLETKPSPVFTQMLIEHMVLKKLSKSYLHNIYIVAFRFVMLRSYGEIVNQTRCHYQILYSE